MSVRSQVEWDIEHPPIILRKNEARKIDLENFIVACCRESSIYLDGEMQAVKYLCGQGKIVYIEQSRMLDFVEKDIPNYDAASDEPIIRELLDSKRLIGCESHEYRDCHYCYTFALKSE